VENAPEIQVDTADTTQRLTDAFDPDDATPTLDSAAHDIVRGPLLKRLPSHAKLSLV
jgi:hypothetical protein